MSAPVAPVAAGEVRCVRRARAPPRPQKDLGVRTARLKTMAADVPVARRGRVGDPDASESDPGSPTGSDTYVLPTGASSASSLFGRLLLAGCGGVPPPSLTLAF